MQAVVLAGGLGTRLRPLTNGIPKVMVPAGGKPFLFYLLTMLKERGVANVVLCTGYMGELVADYFKDGAALGMKISYSRETEKLLGTGGALKKAQNLLQHYFLILNGDTYLPINYREIEHTFLKSGKKALMAVYNNSEKTCVKNNVMLNGSTVVRYDKQGKSTELTYVEAGALILKHEVLDSVPDGEVISLEAGIYPDLIAQREMAAYATDQRFYDIGTPEQLKQFETYLKMVNK